MQYRTIRSKRKTVALEITPDAVLIVRAPYRAGEAYIRKLVQEKSGWIQKHLQKMLAKKNSQLTRKFQSGEKFLFLGRCYALQTIKAGRKRLYFEDKLYISEKYISEAKKILENWYRQQAKELIGKRVGHFTRLHKIDYKLIKITGAAKRWGSCSGKNLNFSWRLIMAPLEIIDYVVMHEIAHLEVKNHSRKFWNKVAGFCPDYQAKRKWLRENGHALTL